MKLLSAKWYEHYIIAAGDIIDFCSLIYQLSQKERVLFPIQMGFLENIKSFFPEDADIEFKEIISYDNLHYLEKTHECINLHAHDMIYKGEPIEPVIESLYVISGLDFERREEFCPIRHQVSRIPQIEPPAEPYAFIPEGGSTKEFSCNKSFVGEGLKIITPPQDALMLSYAKIIENATEIHCHPTSWHRLIEKLPTKGKLFYHLYARDINLKTEQFPLLKDWTILGDNPAIIKDKQVMCQRKQNNPRYLISILICNLADRLPMLNRVLTELQEQDLDKDVQIIWLGDNRSMTTGVKRNWLKRIADGKYIGYLDDDDLPTIDYIKEIKKAALKNPDAICFEVSYHNTKTGTKKSVYFSKDYGDDSHTNDDADILYRKPNHLCFVKRELAPDFPDISHVEDDYYGVKLKPLVKTEVVIPKVLYNYDYNLDISEGQKIPKTMDVIVVSNGTGLRKMTQDCIDSISEESIPVIIEKNTDIKYEKAVTLYQDDEFNYNKYLNQGALQGHEEYICFSNNDILFCRNFVKRAIWEMNAKKLDVGGVFDQNKRAPNDSITGWCFIMRRDVWEKIGHLRESCRFWASDWVVTQQIKGYRYKVLENVFVVHRVSKTLNMLSPEMQVEYKDNCVKKYNKEFNENRFNMGTE